MLLAGVTALISGLAIFLNGYGVRAWVEISDPTTYTTLKNGVAALTLLAVLATVNARRGGRTAKKPERPGQWAGLAVLGLIGGALPFVLFFEGLAMASSVQAAFIHKTLVVWVAILAVSILREKVGPLQLVAIGLLVIGHGVLAGGLGVIELGMGELLILAATLLWSIEVILVKKLLFGVSSHTLALARMGGGSALLVGYTLLRGGFSGLSGMGWEHLIWILLTGLILAGYVGTWFAALSRAPAVDVTAVLVGGAIITALLRGLVAGTALPSPLGLGLIGVGVLVVLLGGHRFRLPGLSSS
jgi:drug/metabolite transporter (DMT)-like permease